MAFSGCVGVFHIWRTCGIFFFFLNPIFSTKEMKETLTHTPRCQMHTCTQMLGSFTHFSHAQQKQSLKQAHTILMLDVHRLARKRTPTQLQWQALSRTQTHSSLFSDKGLLLRLCRDSTKDFFSLQRGLHRDLVFDWIKVLTLFFSPSLASTVSFSRLTSSRGAVLADSPSVFPLFCGGV